jgi:hypothetical protein
MIDKDVDDFLEHYGVLGMKWGVRKDNFVRNRALNKASRARDKVTPPRYKAPTPKPPLFSKEAKRSIDKARKNIKTGKTDHDYKLAKFEYKKNKTTLGSREARKILKKAKKKRFAEIETSRQVRDGGEYVTRALNDFITESAARRDAHLRTQSRARAYPQDRRV